MVKTKMGNGMRVVVANDVENLNLNSNKKEPINLVINHFSER